MRSLLLAALLAGCASSPSPQPPPARPARPAQCLAGADCAVTEYCALPTGGGAPRPPNDPGSCVALPTECRDAPTCECIVGKSAGRTCGTDLQSHVTCSFENRTLNCACLDCP